MKGLLFISTAFFLLVLLGCRKSDNPKVPELETVPLPNLTLAEDAPTKIPGDDPLSFSSSFTLDVYYKHGEMPRQFDLVVMKNGNKSNIKTVQAGITSFPATFEVTGQQLIDLFGEEIALGDAFLFSADVITQEGNRWAAFPEGGEGYAPGIAALPDINTVIRFAAPCLFEPEAYTAGDYEVVVDEWGDFVPGDVTAVEKIDDTHYSFKYLTSDAQPIVMEVNPEDNSITVAPVMYGNYDGIEVTAVGVAGSEVDPCDVSFDVILNHTYFGGDLGNYRIRLKKQ